MCVVNLGASMHMLSKKDLSSQELDTLRRSRNPFTVMTASGEVQTNEEAQVYVHNLDLFVTVQLLDETPPVLSLGKLCSEHKYSYEWKKRRNTTLVQKMGRLITCSMDNFVPLVVPGLSSSSSGSSASTSTPKGQSSSSSESEVTSQHAGERPILTRLPRETVVQQKTRWTRRIQRKAFLTGCSPHIPLTENSDSDASAHVVTSQKHSICTQLPKTGLATSVCRQKLQRFLAEDAVRDLVRVQ